MEDILGKELVHRLKTAGSLEGMIQDDLYEYEEPGLPTLHLLKHMNPPSTMQAMKTWQAREDDIFIVSSPKAGTTWVQEIVCAIVNNQNLETLDKSHSWHRVPCVEATFFHSTKEIEVPPTYKLLEKMPSPRTIKSHLHADYFPPDAWRKKSRVVFVCRNPKDKAVSFYHFHNMNPQLRSYGSFSEFLPDYLSGNVAYGGWAEHNLSWWKRRNEPNVLFNKYEDMKQDLQGTVVKFADFLGYQLSPETIDKIVQRCTFSNMKKNQMANPDFFLKDLESDKGKLKLDEAPSMVEGTQREDPNGSYMRKGEVGDWKNFLTVAENEMFDKEIDKNLEGTGLTFRFQ